MEILIKSKISILLRLMACSALSEQSQYLQLYQYVSQTARQRMTSEKCRKCLPQWRKRK